ncbi:hypothetical protein MMAD_02050 [Mycolicibacterium madagascariense]|uniref:Histidine kinase/HSP90-like ATPase domain-containing protein n=1 Tax=Mycolicibacterium madagascariense TaxID=212765 RepID=A0A7I7X9A3_9MYCO|nr:ATP-binding protein [Mycolicibacterium madagascariense]MCV7013370.1 ATP-binding protein [Mycolicibacterium madagascariense]BBZ25910.1 hypothetical protein MMAD_02050 [Mycolicibacterium madagascariense]
MTPASQPSSDPREHARRRLEGDASPVTVAQWRRFAQDWLNATVAVGEERFADITLAVDEALSNCVDHAYRDRSAGTMVLELSYDENHAVVQIQVTDEGSWQEPKSMRVSDFRGRGVLLMTALADECSVDGHDNGTTVRLVFRDCPPQGASHGRTDALQDTA